MTTPSPSVERLTRRLASLARVGGFLLGMFVTAVLALALYISAGFDETATAEALVEHAQTEWQRELVLEHGVHLSLLPWPSLQLAAGSLSEARRKEAFASWSSASFELEVWPLLRQKLVVRHAQFEDFRLRLARDGKGNWNVADFSAPDEDSPWQLHLEGLAMRHGVIVLDDATHGSVQLRDTEFGCDAIGARRGGRVQMSAQLVTDDERGSGRVALAGRYRFGESIWTGSLAGLQLLAKGQNLDATAQLIELGWQSDALQVQGLSVKTEVTQAAARRTLNLIVPQASYHAGWSAPNAELTWSGHGGEQGSAQDWQAQLRFANFKPDGTGQGSTARLEGSFSAQARDMQVALKLQSSGLHLDHESDAWSLDGLKAELQLMHPLLLRETSFKLGGRMGGTWETRDDAPRLTTDLDIGIAQESVHVATSVDTDDGLDVTARIDTKQLDLDALLAPAAFALPPTRWLKGWSLDAHVHADALRVHGAQLQSFDVPLKLEEGRLQSTSHAAQLYGGRLNGSLDYDSTTKKLVLQEALREVRLGELLHDTHATLPAEGLTNATLEMESELDEHDAITPGAKGVLRVYAKDARWRGIDLAVALLDEKEAMRVDAATSFAEFSAAFNLRGDALGIERMSAHGPALSLTGTGSLQYVDGVQDLALLIKPGNDKRFASLHGKNAAFHLGGRWNAPELRACAVTEGKQTEFAKNCSANIAQR